MKLRHFHTLFRCFYFKKKLSGISGFRRNSEEFCGVKFLGISSEFLKTESQNCDPTKIYHLRDHFWGIIRELPRNQLQERILEKFLRNSSKKKVTTVAESGEITHFCYLGTYKKCASDLQKLCIRPTKSIHPTYY